VQRAIDAGRADPRSTIGAVPSTKVPPSSSVFVPAVPPDANDTSAVPAKSSNSERLYDQQGPERLYLATCGGPWVESARMFKDIHVALATPVPS
jgi:hypothetical protein